MIRVLSVSTLYPNPADPHRGAFLRARLEALREFAAGDVDLRVIAPVPAFPRFLPGPARWRRFAAAPASGAIAGFPALFPRYVAIPKLGVASHVSSLARAMRRAAEAMRRQDEFEPDLVEAHFLFPDGAAAATLAASLGRPLLLVARGTDAHTFPRDERLRGRIAAALGAAHRVAAVSAGLAKDLAPLLSPGRRVAVIPNGVDVRVFHPRPRAEARAALGIRGEGPLVLAVGRLSPVKRPAVIVEALALLSRLQNEAPQDDRDIRGILVGSGELEPAVRSLAERLSLLGGGAGGGPPRLEIVREMPPARLALHYAAADVFVHASEREGCPNVVIEALSSGTPVAATPSEGVSEVTDAVGTGAVLAASGEPLELASAIRRAIDARFDRSAIAAAAAAAFRWETVARSTVSLYRETIAR